MPCLLNSEHKGLRIALRNITGKQTNNVIYKSDSHLPQRDKEGATVGDLKT